jgi:hypothetical protein
MNKEKEIIKENELELDDWNWLAEDWSKM